MRTLTPLSRIDHCINLGSYVQAYWGLMTGLEAAPDDVALLAASSRLAAVLRSRSLAPGSNKATEQSEQTHEIDAILYLVIRLNGEGIYGPIPDKP